MAKRGLRNYKIWDITVGSIIRYRWFPDLLICWLLIKKSLDSSICDVLHQDIASLYISRYIPLNPSFDESIGLQFSLWRLPRKVVSPSIVIIQVHRDPRFLCCVDSINLDSLSFARIVSPSADTSSSFLLLRWGRPKVTVSIDERLWNLATLLLFTVSDITTYIPVVTPIQIFVDE